MLEIETAYISLKGMRVQHIFTHTYTIKHNDNDSMFHDTKSGQLMWSETKSD
jgi:hypothetical protein